MKPIIIMTIKYTITIRLNPVITLQCDVPALPPMSIWDALV